jgi:uncharacterized protein (TIGR00251 family)
MLEKQREKFIATGEAYFRVKARPGASATEVRGVLEGEAGETYKIDVAAPPEQGKANEALIKYLAGVFLVSRSQVEIVSGAGEKIKLIKIKK